MHLPEHRTTNFLTGMRGYAAMWVFLIHTSGLLGLGTNGQFIDHFLAYGGSGVYIFFLLSSLTITISMYNSKHFTSFGYIIKRFFRIFPLYAMIILLGFLLGGDPFYKAQFHSPTYDFQDLFYHLTFLNIFKPEYYSSILAVEKTVNIEFIYYFFLLFLFLIQRKLKDTELSALIILLGGVILYFNFPLVHLPFFQDPALESVLIFYGLGQLVFSYMYHPYSQKNKILLIIKRFIIILLAVLCNYHIEKAIGPQTLVYYRIFVGFIVYLICIKPILNKNLSSSVAKVLSNLELLALIILYFVFIGYSTIDIPIITGICTAAVFLSTKEHSFLSRLLLENKVILYLGTISYSIYLSHWMILQQISRVLEPNLKTNYGVFFLVLAITLLFSSLTYFLIEKPGISFGKKLAKKTLQYKIFKKSKFSFVEVFSKH